MANLLAYGTQIVGGGSSSPSTGGGHVIVNASGTELAQEDKLKFAGGLKTTDDSTNGQTVVDDSPTEIEWSVWNTMTDTEKEAIPKALVVNAPGIDGPIDVDLITKLWENPSPTVAFAAQDITLSSSDYDFLLIVSNVTGGAHIAISSIAQKGQHIYLGYPTYNNGVISIFRTATRVSDTVYSFGPTQVNGQSDNDNLIPVAIYGFKKTITVDVSGIVSDVSTDADKCMMSDGVTSVENKLDDITADTVHDLFTPGSGYYCKYSKRAGLVTIWFYAEYTDNAVGYLNLGLTLPAGYRPSATAYFPAYDDIHTKMTQVQITSDGSFKPYGYNYGTAAHIMGCITYAV